MVAPGENEDASNDSRYATAEVFIPYNWTMRIHEQWVIDLAECLVEDDVDVIIDKCAFAGRPQCRCKRLIAHSLPYHTTQKIEQ
ncbi:hypothetical protein CUJ91_04305 [Paraburkholderia graminis]|nr:hypothetical protein CUJ91_04305 [Paraburkholderia graminis]